MHNQTLHPTPIVKMPPLAPVAPAANIDVPYEEHMAKPVAKVKKVYSTRVKSLAEAVILQAIEDLWSKTHRQKSVEFFLGNGFRHYAEIAGMGSAQRLKLLKMVGRSLAQ